MQRVIQLPTALVMLLAASGAFAAVGDEQATALDHRDVTRVEANAKESDATRLRQTGEKACREAVDTAARMGGQLQRIGNELLPKMAQAGEQFVREIEPAIERLAPEMEKLADRMREIARDMEESLRQRQSGEAPRR